MHIDVSIDNKRVVIVDVVEQLIAGEYFPCIDNQSAQNPKF